MNSSLSGIGSDKIIAPDLAGTRFKANPYPFYARLRVEAPVWPTTLPDKRKAWLVTRYEDVVRVLKDDAFAKDRLNAMDRKQRAKTPWVPGFLKPLERNMLDLDDPDHARLRSLVGKAFTPRLIERLRGRVESLSEELLDAMERKGTRRGGTELVADYALPLPYLLAFIVLVLPLLVPILFPILQSLIVSLPAHTNLLLSRLSFLAYCNRCISSEFPRRPLLGSPVNRGRIAPVL